MAIVDNLGYPVVKYTYDAWGNYSVDYDDSGYAVGYANPFTYRGYFYDNGLGLYYLKSRYYDPKTGRFISQDSIEYLDPESINGLNLYAYCGNNPVMYVDYNGNYAVSTILAVVGLIALLMTGAGVIYGTLSDDTTSFDKDLPSTETNIATVFSQPIQGGPVIDPNPKGWGPNGELSAFQKFMGWLAVGGFVTGVIGAVISFFCPALGVPMAVFGFAGCIFCLTVSGLGGAT